MGMKCYETACWSVSNSKDASGAVQWAKTHLVDHTVSSIFCFNVYSLSRAALVTFGENNTLICPGGIWDLATEEKLACPSSIWKPDDPERINQTSFSANRAVRVRDKCHLEVFELFDGESCKAGERVGTYDFRIYKSEAAPTNGSLHIRKFHHLGD